ncbi:MAG: hypothetical protein KDK91_25800, partial [Gammaproteobacteria bacterium]|nr:hypothetical protein [Gammaproteobacteria bacterium]
MPETDPWSAFERDPGARLAVIVTLASPAEPMAHSYAGADTDRHQRLAQRARRRAAIARLQTGVLDRIHVSRREGYGAGSRAYVRVRDVFSAFPIMTLSVDAAGLQALLEDPRVESVVPEQPTPFALASSLPLLTGQPFGVPLSHDGSGQAVVILDSGVDSTHRAFTGRVVEEACFSRTLTSGGASSTTLCPNGAQTLGASPGMVGAGAAMPCTHHSLCDHGTHVAG